MSRRQFDKEFKINAARLVLEEKQGFSKVSRNLGVGLSTLQRWVREYKADGAGNAFPGSGHLKPDEARFKKLERENEVLKRERDILKKALAIFSSP